MYAENANSYRTSCSRLIWEKIPIYFKFLHNFILAVKVFSSNFIKICIIIQWNKEIDLLLPVYEKLQAIYFSNTANLSILRYNFETDYSFTSEQFGELIPYYFQLHTSILSKFTQNIKIPKHHRKCVFPYPGLRLVLIL